MKSWIITVLSLLGIYFTCEFVFAEDIEGHFSPSFKASAESLPQQAIFCDIAGVGLLRSIEPTQVVFWVKNYWIGGVETNTITITASDDLEFFEIPIDTLCAFTASTNSWLRYGMSTNNYYSTCFVTNRPVFINGTTGWKMTYHTQIMPLTNSINYDVSSFLSNLVSQAHVYRNDTLFYDLISIGATNTNKKISRDCKIFTYTGARWLPTNFVKKVIGFVPDL